MFQRSADLIDSTTVLWSELANAYITVRKLWYIQYVYNLEKTTLSSVEVLSDLVFWHESWTLFTSDCCIRWKNNSKSKTFLLNIMSVIEDILVLLIAGFSYYFTSFLSRYSTFSVFLFCCISCISTFSPWEISSLFIGCVTNPLCNRDTFNEKKSSVLHFSIDSIYTKDQKE